MTVSRASFKELVDKLHAIPSLPEVVSQIADATNDPSANAQTVRDLVIKDAAMAAKMLRMVNSVFYGLKDPVRDLGQAVVILGFRTVRSIAMSVGVLNAFQQRNACFNMRVCWTHSAASAALGRLIAQRTGAMDPETAFLAGLLRSTGRIVLAQNAPDETRAIMAVAREYALPFHRAAREVLDADDAEIAAWLCDRWELERGLAAAVRDQYRLADAEAPAAVAIGLFAEHLCALKSLRAPGDHHIPQLDPSVWHHLGLDKTALVELMTEVDTEVGRAKALIGD